MKKIYTKIMLGYIVMMMAMGVLVTGCSLTVNLHQSSILDNGDGKKSSYDNDDADTGDDILPSEDDTPVDGNNTIEKNSIFTIPVTPW